VLRRCPDSSGTSAGSEAPPEVQAVLDTSGNPLDSATRGFMQRRLGHNFADVRVHADEQAARSASSVGSVAYTVGRDVVFGAASMRPRRWPDGS